MTERVLVDGCMRGGDTGGQASVQEGVSGSYLRYLR